MEDVPWLREMVEPALLPLFSQDEQVVEKAVRNLIHLVHDDSQLEMALVELVETSVEHRNDDTLASTWATVVLGECRSTLAMSPLLRALALEDEELLQDFAKTALLRIGVPALEVVMEVIDDGAGVAFRRSAYDLLGMVGVLDDDFFCRRVEEFLETRLPTERHTPREECAIEQLFLANAQLGCIRHIDAMKAILQEDYDGEHATLEDAIGRLEDNSDGVPFVGTQAPWEERYGWLFEDGRERSPPSGSGSEPQDS
jgi:hypothetical protein